MPQNNKYGYLVSNRPAWLSGTSTSWETKLPDGKVIHHLDRRVFEEALAAARRAMPFREPL